MILFQHSEYAFSLYASVHSELSSEFGRYIFQAFCSQFFELMRYRQRLVSFCLCTILFVGTTFATFTSVQCFLRNESGLRFLMLCTDTPQYPSCPAYEYIAVSFRKNNGETFSTRLHGGAVRGVGWKIIPETLDFTNHMWYNENSRLYRLKSEKQVLHDCRAKYFCCRS